MNPVFRIIDANVNRTAEGLRVLEDLVRFTCGQRQLAGALRELRHRIRKTAAPLYDLGLACRDAAGDPGLRTSQQSTIGRKTGIRELAIANCKRVQEGLRSLEEQLKLLHRTPLAKAMEACRFQAYELEQQVMAHIQAQRRQTILDTDLYCLTAESFSRGRSNLEVVRAMLDAGIRLIQYREKDKDLKDQLAECREIRRLTREAGASFIVNDQVALALMVEADGIHVGQEDLPVSEIRSLVGDGMAIGLSTHSPEQARAAAAAGADYIGVGPIFSTQTKHNVCAPVGLEYLDFVVGELDIPFVAIGGIKEHNLGEVVRHGASCVAMVTEIVGADDIGSIIARLRAEMAEARG